MKLFVLCFFLPIGLVVSLPARVERDLSSEELEDAHLSVTGLLTKYGYPSEKHTVQTDDGYLLTLYRIPYGKKCGPEAKRRAPVLVQHGLLCSSIDWLVMGPDKGLGYILADHCYDVWLGNNRGNHESRAHVSLDVNSAEFWDFSWHEMGFYDLPAFVDYITYVTKEPSIHYVGHSQGTTQFFIFASEHPEYSSKILSMQALAPVAFMNHLDSPLVQFLSNFEKPISWIADVMGINEFLPNNGFISSIGGAACTDAHPTLQSLCGNVLFILCGYDSEQLNATMLPVIVGHTPAGAATKQLSHYAQGVNSGLFRQFDYGKKENKKRYGTDTPPEYDLSRVNVSIALHFSDNDWMAAREDVDRLAAALKHSTLLGKFRVNLDKFNHLDYMWAIDINPLLHDKVLNLMDRF